MGSNCAPLVADLVLFSPDLIQEFHGEKDSIKRRHPRHHQRQPVEQLFPIQVVTG